MVVLEVEIISTLVAVVAVVVVLEVEIISTLVAVVAVVGLCRGRSSSDRRSILRALLFGVCPVDN